MSKSSRRDGCDWERLSLGQVTGRKEEREKEAKKGKGTPIFTTIAYTKHKFLGCLFLINRTKHTAWSYTHCPGSWFLFRGRSLEICDGLFLWCHLFVCRILYIRISLARRLRTVRWLWIRVRIISFAKKLMLEIRSLIGELTPWSVWPGKILLFLNITIIQSWCEPRIGKDRVYLDTLYISIVLITHAYNKVG